MEEAEVLKGITRVYAARRTAQMRVADEEAGVDAPRSKKAKRL